VITFISYVIEVVDLIDYQILNYWSLTFF